MALNIKAMAATRMSSLRPRSLRQSAVQPGPGSSTSTRRDENACMCRHIICCSCKSFLLLSQESAIYAVLVPNGSLSASWRMMDGRKGEEVRDMCQCMEWGGPRCIFLSAYPSLIHVCTYGYSMTLYMVHRSWSPPLRCGVDCCYCW